MQGESKPVLGNKIKLEFLSSEFPISRLRRADTHGVPISATPRADEPYKHTSFGTFRCMFTANRGDVNLRKHMVC
jgi:hypothetical protein